MARAALVCSLVGWVSFDKGLFAGLPGPCCVCGSLRVGRDGVLREGASDALYL